jgi:predicted acylesterase/phospholipase RssA
MARMVRLFTDAGPAVFSRRALPASAIGRIVDLGRSVIGPKYDGTALRRALVDEFGTRTLADAGHAVVVPAVDVGQCCTKVFKSPHVPASAGDGDLAAVDVAMASAAAPTYFPSVPVGGRLYADGGLFAVAPDQVALHEAEHFAGIDVSRVRMLALGTAASGYRPAGGAKPDNGAVSWLADGRLVMTLIAAQQQHVQAMMEDRLGARYLRLDAAWPMDAGLALDVATVEAAAHLRLLALQTIDGLPGPSVLRAWIGER